MMLRLHMATFGVCVSYVTLGIFASDTARDWWAPYAGLTFLLASLVLWLEYRNGGRNG